MKAMESGVWARAGCGLSSFRGGSPAPFGWPSGPLDLTTSRPRADCSLVEADLWTRSLTASPRSASAATMAASTQTQSALAARRCLERPSRRAFGVPQDEAEGGGTRPESMLSLAGSRFCAADRPGREAGEAEEQHRPGRRFRRRGRAEGDIQFAVAASHSVVPDQIREGVIQGAAAAPQCHRPPGRA
jgi:hypothetical protein